MTKVAVKSKVLVVFTAEEDLHNVEIDDKLRKEQHTMAPLFQLWQQSLEEQQLGTGIDQPLVLPRCLVVCLALLGLQIGRNKVRMLNALAQLHEDVVQVGEPCLFL